MFLPGMLNIEDLSNITNKAIPVRELLGIPGNLWSPKFPVGIPGNF